MRRAAPLRFLATTLGGWIGLRAVLLAPAWWETAPQPAPAPQAWAARLPLPASRVTRPDGAVRQVAAAGPDVQPRPVAAPLTQAMAASVNLTPASSPPSSRGTSARRLPALSAEPPILAAALAAAPGVPLLPMASAPGAARWSVSLWALIRSPGGERGLAQGGTLGGSQAGGRFLYRLGERVSLSARAYLPLGDAAGAEIAAGVDWRPIASVPVNLLAERRQALGHDGRSAFSLIAYGGVGRTLAADLRLETYAQAGLVGLRRRDAFVDAAVRVSRSLGRLDLGAGVWGAAQPGVARLDAGPSASLRLPALHARLQADWRFRLAGEAAPGSGPALTLAADF